MPENLLYSAPLHKPLPSLFILWEKWRCLLCVWGIYLNTTVHVTELAPSTWWRWTSGCLPYIAGCTEIHKRWVSCTVSYSRTKLIQPWHKVTACKSMQFLTGLCRICLWRSPIVEIIPLPNTFISKLWATMRMLITLLLFIGIYSL